MTATNRVFKLLTEFRKQINATSKPEAGISGLRISEGELKAQLLLAIGFLAIVLALALSSEEPMQVWHPSALFMTMVLTLFPGSLMLWKLESGTKEILDSNTLLTLVLTSAALGIPLGHLGLWGMNFLYPVGNAPFPLTFVPEFTTLVAMLFGYWRLVYIRQWQFKVDTEKLKREAAEHGQSLAQAQLKMLQAQIEPHFLFNTLASVQHLVRKDAQRADFLLTELIRYLRQSMPDFRGMGSTLGREFGLNEAYLNIAKIRMGSRLKVTVSLPEALVEVPFPPLVIQTLVENAIKHGVEPKTGAVRVSILAREVLLGDERFIEISVIDDGVGFGQAATSGSGVGLRNIQERMAGLYGEKAQLEVFAANPTGVCATVRVPVSSGLRTNGSNPLATEGARRCPEFCVNGG